MKQFALICFFIIVWVPGYAQNNSAKKDSILSKITFKGDFRFRAEQDWDSRKSDGTYRDDRTRLRYRLRAGFDYQINSWSKFGVAIRTGLLNKQQDPQLTLGDGFGDNGILPIGIYNVFYKIDHNGYKLALGKINFPFEKNNELFWSDHVCPEGVYAAKRFTFDSGFANYVGISAGHFILQTSGKNLDLDRYLQGVQLTTSFWDKRLKINPGFFYLNRIRNFPDGFGTFDLDYRIFNLSFKGDLLKNRNLKFNFDFYHNMTDLSQNENIPTSLRDQQLGLSAGLSYGKLKDRNDWLVMLTYAYIEKYSAVDYFTQNDWARWDYSGLGSPDGRLTNMKGLRLTLGYAIRKNYVLKLNAYRAEQIVAEGLTTETGSRIRLDLDIKF